MEIELDEIRQNVVGYMPHSAIARAFGLGARELAEWVRSIKSRN